MNQLMSLYSTTEFESSSDCTTPPALSLLREAAINSDRVKGLTHRHYKYPARFSPTFVSEAIKQFSKPGDLVLDPYMGGGTSIVEAIASGRRAVGCDLNSLAVFVSKLKTSVLSGAERRQLSSWVYDVALNISFRDSLKGLDDVICEARTKNLNVPRARAIKKYLALALASIEELATKKSRDFARGVLLNSAQWALNGRKNPVTLTEFRSRVCRNMDVMLAQSNEFAEVLNKLANTYRPVLIHDSSENIKKHKPFAEGGLADFVVTSPPYPGVHILYHRWQVDGRKETAAPYWIANCLDGQGSSYYNFGRRFQPNHDDYFESSLKTLKSIRTVMRTGASIVQMIAFSDMNAQLPRYLRCMSEAGFIELNDDGRIWRQVPGRSWHAQSKGVTQSAKEVVLVHRAI